MTTATIQLDEQICDQARKTRDPRFDGLFFTAVVSTRIYCRPVCPAPAPKPSNIRYYPNAASAEAAGFRPCLRCRPELAPGSAQWRQADHHVARALRAINDGALLDGGLEGVCARIGIGTRQLRRLFDQNFGTSPIAVATTQRLLFAKQLLTETRMSMIDVAMASGFGSLRRFNDAFQSAYRMPPSRLRQSEGNAPGQLLQLRLGYRPPFDFRASLQFLGQRALPGLEEIDGQSYRRHLQIGAQPAWFEVRNLADAHALQVTAHGVGPLQLADVVRRIRRQFDLDADPASVEQVLRAAPRFRHRRNWRPGLRIPGGYDGFEVAVRAILGQQISVTATTTFARRLLEQFGVRSSSSADESVAAFPAPEILAEADLERIGLIRSRAQTLRLMARAVADRRLHFASEQALDAFVADWTAIPGIGDWTANYIALRALSHPDAFPAGDLILRREATGDGGVLTEKQLRDRAAVWRPWRAYAVLQLWTQSSTP